MSGVWARSEKREGFLKKTDRNIFQNATTNTRGNASEKHQKLIKNMFQKYYQNSSRRLPGTPWGPPARKLRPRTRPRPPLGPSGAPKTNFGSAPSAPRAPQRGQQGLRTPPPGRPKMVQNATEQFKGKPLGAPGRPQSRRRGIPKQFRHDFCPSRPLFFERSGLRFRSSQGTKPTTPLTTRKRIDPTRRAGGVIPEWPLASLGGPGEPKSDF